MVERPLCMRKAQGSNPCSSILSFRRRPRPRRRCHFVATDIFTGKKLEDLVPSTHGTTVPNVFRAEYTLLDITDEDYLTLMDDGGETREDLKMPTANHQEEVIKAIRDGFEAGDSMILAVMKAMGEEHVMAAKKDTSA